MQKIIKLFFWLNIILCLCTLGAYFAPYVNPHQFSLLSFLGLSFPILVLMNMLFVVFWLMVKIKYAGLSFITLACGWAFLKGFIAFNVGQVKPAKQNFSIVSYNISNASKAYDKVKAVKKEKSENLIEFLKRFKDEDVVCLQEVGGYAYDLIKKEFNDWNHHKLQRGAMIMSKHPIFHSGEISFGTITNSCLWADLIINFDTVRVYSMHLQSNQITKDAEEMINNGNKDNKETWQGVKGILRKYHHYHLIRATQSEMIKLHAKRSPYPVIICGDMNDTPVSYTYAHLSENMNDVFYKRGKGIGTTYNGKIPFLRIDYILSDLCLQPAKFSIIKEPYSDHYPVAALINYNCKPKP